MSHLRTLMSQTIKLIYKEIYSYWENLQEVDELEGLKKLIIIYSNSNTLISMNKADIYKNMLNALSIINDYTLDNTTLCYVFFMFDLSAAYFIKNNCPQYLELYDAIIQDFHFNKGINCNKFYDPATSSSQPME